jgi:hypothetical protein
MSGGVFTGCASTAIPFDQYGQPRQTIRVVTEMGAEENPQARLHLKLAKDELANADKFIKQEEKEKAKLSLMRAEADASLALALLERDEMKTEVEELQAKIDRLRKETRQLQGNS